MKLRWVVLGVGAASLGGAVAAAPAVAVAFAARLGVTIERAGWCSTGMCLHGVRAPALHGLRAAHMAVDWDRTVRLVDVQVSRDSGAASGAAAGQSASSGAPGDWTGWLNRVTVQDLRVDETPLPALSGEVYPERHLIGEQVSVEGDVADANLDTPYGRVHLRVEPSSGGVPGALSVAADARALAVPASVLGEPFTVPEVYATGVYEDGSWRGTVGARALDVPTVVDIRGGTVTLTLTDAPIAGVYAAVGDVVPEARRAHILGSFTGIVTLGLHADGNVSVALASPGVQAFRVEGLVPDDLRDTFTYATEDAAESPSSRTAGPAVQGWLPLARIGPTLPAAVIAAEDATFYSHPGFDLQSMVDAATENAERGEVHRGGSTLTQQLAKNLYLDGTRSYVRKLRELLYAVNLEGRLGKLGILETYLNIVEFGPGIYGCEAAADRYFLKSPAGLLPEEAAWLASILPSPTSGWTQQYKRDRPNMARVRGILDNMLTLPEGEREAAKQRAIHFVR